MTDIFYEVEIGILIRMGNGRLLPVVRQKLRPRS